MPSPLTDPEIRSAIDACSHVSGELLLRGVSPAVRMIGGLAYAKSALEFVLGIDSTDTRAFEAIIKASPHDLDRTAAAFRRIECDCQKP